jgi:hypothetical protein
MQKVEIEGASTFTKRFFSECGQFQWAREFLQNSVEAGATRVEFGLEWQSVVKHKIYRRVISDNGCGMTPDELVTFFKTLGVSSKSTEGLENNYGIGAKIASLPWNPLGVTVISYSKKNGRSRGAMIRIFESPAKEYCLHEFRDEREGLVSSIDPDVVDWAQYDWSEYNPDWSADNIDWSAVVPEWVKQAGQGTVVVLHGSREYPHTMMGINAQDITKGLSTYLNTRFWEFPGVEEIKVAELKGEQAEGKWPLGPDDTDTKRTPNNRTIQGARYYIEQPCADEGQVVGQVAHSGTMEIDQGRVRLHWFLWEGRRPKYGAYAEEKGYVGVRYMRELYDTDRGKVRFRHFGIIETQVTDRLTLLLEPNRAKVALDWGVYPNQARSRLEFSNGVTKQVELPWSSWGEEFYRAMPEPIKKAIAQARGEGQGQLDDEEYRKRLQELFGNRWRVKVDVVKAGPGVVRRGQATPVTGGSGDGAGNGGGGASAGMQREVPSPGSDAGVQEESGAAGKALQAVSIPVYRMAVKEEFMKPWHLAMWVPVRNEVCINTGSEILQKLEEYHVDRYPAIHEEDIRKEIRAALGEIAVAKVAHSQQLKHLVNKEILDKQYRSEEALTIALMGYIAEDRYIALKLRRFGKASDGE